MTSLVPRDNMFDKTCRTCLNTIGEMVSIFSSDFYVKQLPKKLMAFTGVEISDADDLPKMICKKCMFMADSFYCFKEQCESANNQLKELIRRNSTRDNSFVEEKKLDSDSPRNRITILKNVDTDVKNLKTKRKKVSQPCQKTDENYVVEYISEEVKNEVENAYRRRLEAEKRINMEKLTESIKNLEGIEVLPIENDNTAASNGRKNKIEKDEIVVFPLKVSKKRSQILKDVETIVVDDPPPLNKRLRLPPDTTVSKINGDGSLKGKDFIVYGKHKKLNFSTVRKVVKMDDEEISLERKEDSMKTLNEENCKARCDTDVILVSDDNEKQDPRLRINKRENKLRRDSRDGEKNLKTQLVQFSDVISVRDRNAIIHNGDRKQQTNFTPTGNEDTTIILASQESKDRQRRRAANNLQNYNIIEESTIGCINSGIEDSSLDEINQADDREDSSNLKRTNNSTKSFGDYRTDKSNEVFIENEVGKTDNKPVENIRSHTMSCLESRKIEADEGNENLELNSSSFIGSPKLNSLRISEGNDSERIKGTRENNSSVGNENPVSSSPEDLSDSGLKFYQCTVCSMKFCSMPSVLKHNIEEHMADENPFFCLICDKSFLDKFSLCEHVEEHNGSKPYKCTFCPKTFTLQRNLKRHVDHHINYKPFECPICMKRFTEKSSLKSHMYLHTRDSPFACKSCNVSFNNKTNWRRHVMTIHEKLTTVLCKFCNKELPNKRSLRVHTRVHTGDKPYQCPHCDKRFTQQCNLNTHIHCHLNDRPFACPHCEKGFNQRGTRDDHVLTHTGEKPYQCTECDASFTVSSALKRHLWIHTNKERPYNCENCKLQFVGLYEFRRHRKNRHGEVVKPENPRVERVPIDDRIRKEDGSNIFAESELDIVRFSETKITAKENSSLSCNVNKIEDTQREVKNVKFSEPKIENCNNGAKEESVSVSLENLLGDESSSTISVPDIIENRAQY